MNPVFADTFYWIALTNPLDAAHGRANEVMNDIVTTEEILTEYLNYFCNGPYIYAVRRAWLPKLYLTTPPFVCFRRAMTASAPG